MRTRAQIERCMEGLSIFDIIIITIIIIIIIIIILSFDMKQIKKGRNNNIRVSVENSLLHVSGL